MVTVASVRAPGSGGGAPLTLKERSDLVLKLAQVLQTNGQSTDTMLAAAQQLGCDLGLATSIIPRWGELQLQAEDGGDRSVAVRASLPNVPGRAPVPLAWSGASIRLPT